MHYVFLTGAGISADSGVSTFRDPQGVWATYDWREVATPEAFMHQPEKVHEFYNRRRLALPDASPNPAHFALAAFEKELKHAGHNFTLITQNVDDLHERAGSKTILPMHGRLDRVECLHCGAVHAWHDALSPQTRCPTCNQAQGLRPYVVWFGETPRFITEVENAMASASHFISIGTSGSVYPAAGLVAIAQDRNIPATEINLDPSDNAELFTHTLYGRAAEAVPHWIDRQRHALNLPQFHEKEDL
ncbi:MAG: NAD-dependent deacylase [Pseudomonadota bacterium]